MKTINDLNERYDLELGSGTKSQASPSKKRERDKVVDIINKNKYKLVLLQFPDGLKLYATAVVDYLREKTNSEFLIWFGSCYGACDTPVGLEKLKIDLVIQFGHNELMPSY